MTDSEEIAFREEDVPIDGIEETIEEVIEIFGGEVTERGDAVVRFALPRRRGVAVAGGVACRIEWNGSAAGTGTVRLIAGRDIEAPRSQQVALLSVGSLGAILGLMWPFFPEMAALSGIGIIVAFATYFLTLKRTPGGTAAEILLRISRAQREARDERVQ